jgi:hypothetical protein
MSDDRRSNKDSDNGHSEKRDGYKYVPCKRYVKTFRHRLGHDDFANVAVRIDFDNSSIELHWLSMYRLLLHFFNSHFTIVQRLF